MKNRILVVGAIVILVALVAWPLLAQRQAPPRSGMQGALYANAAEAEIVVLTGTVTAVNLATGQGMPSITLHTATGDFAILVGPYRILADSKFEIKPGQSLEVKAFQDPRMTGVYAATELKDTSTGATLVLRDAAGMPPAGGGMGRGRGMGMGPGFGSGIGAGAGSGMGGGMGRGMMRGSDAMQGMRGRGVCPDCAGLNLEGKTTLVGAVQSVTMGAGQGFPSFTLLAADGHVYTVMTGPFWALQQADFAIAASDRLSVTAYPSLQHEGAFVAAEIQNLDTQKIVKLRDENGVPLGMRGRGPMKGVRK